MKRSKTGRRTLPSKAASSEARRHLANLIEFEERESRGRIMNPSDRVHYSHFGVKGCIYLALHGRPEWLHALLVDFQNGKLDPLTVQDMGDVIRSLPRWLDKKRFDAWLEVDVPRPVGNRTGSARLPMTTRLKRARFRNRVEELKDEAREARGGKRPYRRDTGGFDPEVKRAADEFGWSYESTMSWYGRSQRPRKSRKV